MCEEHAASDLNDGSQGIPGAATTNRGDLRSSFPCDDKQALDGGMQRVEGSDGQTRRSYQALDYLFLVFLLGFAQHNTILTARDSSGWSTMKYVSSDPP